MKVLYWGIMFYPLSVVFFLWGMCLWAEDASYITEWTFFKSGGIIISYLIMFDWLGVLFASVVALISGSVLIFSSWYMRGEVFMSRFVRLVGLFVLSMFLLLFSCSLVGMMLGWDGLGLVSFILVMYYENQKSLGAAMVTALTNRSGDAMLLVAIGLSLPQGHWCISEMWTSTGFMVGLLVVLAACTKSAQMPFCSWLPLAMAAPTPVSALVHSSTLVTAGIFVLIRFHDFLSSSEVLMGWLMLVSSMTMLGASGAAMVECDLKKIVALSTLSHLGLMGLSLGLGCWWFSFFHMVVHAIMKAMLFLCVGVLLHDFGHAQDLRMMGNLAFCRPISTTVVLLSMMGLSGMPFLAGYYSKHAIFSGLLSGSISHLLAFASLFVVLFTGFYSSRFVYMAYFSPLAGSPIIARPSEGDCLILVPFFVLGVGAIGWGMVMSWCMTPMMGGSTYWYFDYLSLALLFGGAVIGKMAMVEERRRPFVFCKIGNFLYNMWYIKTITSQPILDYYGELSEKNHDDMDRGWVESLSQDGMDDLIQDAYGLVQGNMGLVASTRLGYGMLKYFIIMPLFRL